MPMRPNPTIAISMRYSSRDDNDYLLRLRAAITCCDYLLPLLLPRTVRL